MFTQYVCGFYISIENILLIEKQKPAWQKGKWNGIGGKVEKDESSIDAMIREFKEETGAVTNQSRWTKIVEWNRVREFVVDFYVCFGQMFKEIEEKEKLQWWPLKSLPNNVIPNLNWLIPLCHENTVKFPIQVFEKE